LNMLGKLRVQKQRVDQENKYAAACQHGEYIRVNAARTKTQQWPEHPGYDPGKQNNRYQQNALVTAPGHLEIKDESQKG
jgi:hypothetical protein